MLIEAELLRAIKSGLNITGNFFDDTLLMHMREVIQYLIDAGVKEDVIYSASSVGTICRGVTDLWADGAGNGAFSNFFMQRAIQLKYKEVGKSE